MRSEGKVKDSIFSVAIIQPVSAYFGAGAVRSVAASSD
jgi:hypothetical protein